MKLNKRLTHFFSLKPNVLINDYKAFRMPKLKTPALQKNDLNIIGNIGK